MRHKALLIATVATLAATISCGSRSGTEAGNPAGKAGETASTPATVALSLKSSLQGRNLRFEGTTDLPDDTLMAYEVKHEDFVRRMDIPNERMFADGQAVVKGGHYSANVKLEGWPRGQVEVWVAFQTLLGASKKQPPGVLARFGEMGENLAGANVSESGGMKRVELTDRLRLP